MNNNIECTLIKSLAVNNRLGEGITWDPQRQSAWWTDIYGQRLYCYHLDQDRVEHWHMPERVGCFGLVQNSPQLIVAFESGIGYYDVHSAKVQWLAKPEANRVGNRFNDGKVDPFGRFWAGGMVERPVSANQTAGLYHIDAEAQVTLALDGFHISNGLCWSGQGTTLYHADSPSRTIYRYDFDPATYQVSNRQLFAQTEPHCVPDGATVDAQGGLWSAHWGGGKVVRYLPNGEVSLVLKVPTDHPTCVTFGGPDMTWLLVTTANEWLNADQRKQQPDGGNLLIYQTNIKGIETTFFTG